MSKPVKSSGACAVNAFRVSAIVLFCFQIRAAETVFPSAGGDLASQTAWGDSAPGSSDTVIVDQDGTYTASSDLAFGALSVTAGNVTFDFSQTPSRKVVFDGSVRDALTLRKAKSQTVFKGGEWTSSEAAAGSCFFYCGAGSYDKVHNHDVVLEGCVWTNLNRVYVSNNESGCRLTVDGLSRVYAKQFFLMYKKESNCGLDILGGSAMYLSDTANPFYSDNGDGARSGSVRVAGVGSLLSAPSGVFQIGNSASGLSLVVSNHASVVAGQFFLGRTKTAAEADVLVSDGASLTASVLHLRSAGGGMTVSNASLTVTSVKNAGINVGYGEWEGGSFVLSGENAEIDYASEENWIDVFAQGARKAEFRIENGADWSLENSARLACKASDSVFKVVSEGSFDVGDGAGTLEFGPGSYSYGHPALSVSNRVEVCDGAVLGIGGLRLSGCGNALVVSNATVNCRTRNEDNVLHVGYRYFRWGEGTNSVDCALVLRGETPKVYAPDTQLSVYGDSVLRIEVPEEGYAKGFVPLEIKHLTVSGVGARFEIDCEDFFAKTGGKITLATVSDSSGLTATATIAMLEETAATLPPECVLSWIDKKLVLKSPRRCGFFINIR